MSSDKLSGRRKEMEHRGRVYVREAGDELRLGNRFLELGFSKRDGSLVSLIDKHTGYQFIRNPSAPRVAFELLLRRGKGGSIESHDSTEATRFEWGEEEQAERITLILRASGFSRPEVVVELKVSLSAESPLSLWRMKVSGVGEDVLPHGLTCPSISGLVKLGEPAPGEVLVAPVHGEGYIFRNPFPVQDRLPLCSGPGARDRRCGGGAG